MAYKLLNRILANRDENQQGEVVGKTMVPAMLGGGTGGYLLGKKYGKEAGTKLQTTYNNLPKTQKIGISLGEKISRYTPFGNKFTKEALQNVSKGKASEFLSKNVGKGAALAGVGAGAYGGYLLGNAIRGARGLKRNITDSDRRDENLAGKTATVGGVLGAGYGAYVGNKMYNKSLGKVGNLLENSSKFSKKIDNLKQIFKTGGNLDNEVLRRVLKHKKAIFRGSGALAMGGVGLGAGALAGLVYKKARNTVQASEIKR